MKKEATVLPAEPNDDEDFDVTPEGMSRGQKARAIRKARTSIGANQVDFANRFRVPVGTLRDWEQARVMPPEYAVAYARVIQADPDFVERAIA